MPFTPTHVAAVLPGLPWLRGRHIPASALVIGSMIPDAGVFLPSVVNYNVTHTVGGLFTLCLPLGIAAFCAWEYFLRAPLIDLAPRWARARINGPRGATRTPLTLRTLLWAVGLTLVGAASHVFWDSFTHAGRWGVRALPFLERTWLTLPDCAPVRQSAMPGYRVGQYGSTFLFLPLVALYAAVQLKRTEPTGDPTTAVPAALRHAILAGFALLPALVAGRDIFYTLPRAPLRVVAVRAVIAAGVTLMIAVVVYAAGHSLFARKR